MFRNQYDNDAVTLYVVTRLYFMYSADDLFSSPQGRIFQVEYAQEAVKQGSVVVGIASKTHVVLAAIKVRPPIVFHASPLRPGHYLFSLS